MNVKKQSHAIPFSPGCMYHVYNHANGDENSFKEKDNYRYFLERYTAYIHPIADTFAYCLLPNHFHFLLRLKTTVELSKTYIALSRIGAVKLTDSQQLSNLRYLERWNSLQFSN